MITYLFGDSHLNILSEKLLCGRRGRLYEESIEIRSCDKVCNWRFHSPTHIDESDDAILNRLLLIKHRLQPHVVELS